MEYTIIRNETLLLTDNLNVMRVFVFRTENISQNNRQKPKNSKLSGQCML